MRKHWWQSSADPSKPQSCGLSRLHLTVWWTQPSHWSDTRHFFLRFFFFYWTSAGHEARPSAFVCQNILLCCTFLNQILDIHYWIQTPVLFQSVYWVGCWARVLERCSKPSKERLSVFLENVRQEMPKAHLELLHSGSLCVTAEASGALLCLPACLSSNPLLCARLSLPGRERTNVSWTSNSKQSVCECQINLDHQMLWLTEKIMGMSRCFCICASVWGSVSVRDISCRMPVT